MKIRFVSFDVDGTLVDYSFANAVWLEGIPRLYAEEEGISMDLAKVIVKREYDKVGMERLEWYDINYWLDRFRLRTGTWKTLLKKYRHLIRAYPETYEALRTLRDRGYKLIVISNASRKFLDTELDETNIASYFRQIFSATSDFNKVKKNEVLYRKILDILDVKPSQVIHVGDNWHFDYLAPRKTGMESFFLDRENSKSGKYIVKNLTELLSKIL
ncbi:MAG: HAD family hydrolase [Candidatus Korarchaeota archaeon]|nr:HAD family hydrolase [Candidatus Korarchaeota archaeon]